jgi:hypothetical protein
MLMSAKRSYDGQMLDVTAPEVGVEVEVQGDVLWVSVDGQTALRVCRIPEPVSFKVQTVAHRNVQERYEGKIGDQDVSIVAAPMPDSALTRRDKARALVAEGLADNMTEAYEQLTDMGD